MRYPCKPLAPARESLALARREAQTFAMPAIFAPSAIQALTGLAQRALARRDGLVVLGLSGAQGSGKSTLAAALQQAFCAQGVATATLSLDDLYCTRAGRQRLATMVHPMLATRGVPGTHDVALGLATIAALERGEPALLPRFDKARDDRRLPAPGDRAPHRTRLLLFEGWCIGALPQSATALTQPINALEAEEDGAGRWRNYANAALAGAYQTLWARIDALAMLRAPDFATIVHWRQQQEHALRDTTYPAPHVMNDTEVIRFVAHYERITRQILADLPGRADCVIDLDANRQVTRIRPRD